MSSDANLILEVIPPGHGWALDLGGGKGMMRDSIKKLGYRYVNFDIENTGNAQRSIIGDAHVLPFKDGCFEILISKDTLEHFLKPWAVVDEVHRVLKESGLFIIWVPFMHPFHGNDVYRYSPLGLQHLLQNFEIISFESPLWVFTVISSAITEILKRLHLGFIARSIKQACGSIDRIFTQHQKRPSSFAAAYRIVASKRDKREDQPCLQSAPQKDG